MKHASVLPSALSAAIVSALLLSANSAHAIIPQVKCDAPSATSALTTGGTQQTVAAAGGCTTSAVALASTNGLVLSRYTYDPTGGSQTYTNGSGTYVRFYGQGLLETGANGTGQTLFGLPAYGSVGAQANTVNASGVFTNYTNNLYNAGGLVASLNPNTVAVAVNNANAVAGTQYGSKAEPVYVAAGATTGVNLDTLGFGGSAASINNAGQVAGVLNQADGSARAFYTAANGGATHVLGAGPGVSSAATVIADDGQVGGFVTLASGQVEAFLTTIHGTLVGIAAGASTDNTETIYANSLGQAIVDDLSSQSYYLYSSGTLVPVASLFSGGLPSDYVVAGLDNAGQILIQDPELVSPDLTAFVPQTLTGLVGAQTLESTQSYTDFVNAQGGATPDPGFVAPPHVPTQGSVPEPGLLSLAGLAGALAIGLRRRRALAN